MKRSENPIVVWLAVALVLLAAGIGTAHADRPYGIRYTANINGSFALIGNSQMTCAAGGDWGAINWAFGGTLAPGACGAVTFQVLVQN